MNGIGRLTDRLSVSHYDLVLAAIPSVFVLAVLAGNLLFVSANVAVAAAAVVATLALVDALFVNPPVSD
jgi:membrane protein YdbS with pleckstrin-like domain